MFGQPLTSEQQMMVNTARKLVRSKIIDSRLDLSLDKSAEFPHEIFKILWENGLCNLEIPQAYGGSALSCYEHCLVLEEIQYGCLGIGTTVAANLLAAMPLILAKQEQLNHHYLRMLVEQPVYAAYCCSEPDAGSDVAAMSTKYRKVGNTYVLNGLKRWITNGDVASWYLVFAREEGSKGHRGIAAFVVDANLSGVKTDGLVHKMGQKTSHTCDVILEEVVLPASRQLVGPDDGFKLAMATFDRSRPWIGCAAAGVIRRAKDESLKYSLERKTFGTAIINHQMIQAMLADMEVSYLATRLLTLNAASCIDRGELRGVHSACAKVFGADAAMQTTINAIQIFGGYGYTQEFVVEKLARDAKLLQLYEGTCEIQRVVISRDMERALAS